VTDAQGVGAVARLWRFPVKSMLGERLEQADVTARGLLGDRAYGLVDTESGKVVTAKNVKQFGRLFGCRAAFVEPPRLKAELPPVRIVFPDGNSATSDSVDCDRVLSSFFKHEVRLVQVGPEEHYANKARRFEEIGIASPLPARSLFDAFPLSILTTSTIGQANSLRPQSRFDERRFRMNVTVATAEPGFIENAWIGRSLQVGDGVRLEVSLPDSRCVMTTLPLEELPGDPAIMTTLAEHNSLRVGGLGEMPCAGVYAMVSSPGTVRVGDPVLLRSKP